MTANQFQTAMKAIRALCLDCSGQSTREVRLCRAVDCPLWPFRMGKRPSTLERKQPELLDPAAVVAAGLVEK